MGESLTVQEAATTAAYPGAEIIADLREKVAATQDSAQIMALTKQAEIDLKTVVDQEIASMQQTTDLPAIKERLNNLKSAVIELIKTINPKAQMPDLTGMEEVDKMLIENYKTMASMGATGPLETVSSYIDSEANKLSSRTYSAQSWTDSTKFSEPVSLDDPDADKKLAQ